MSWIVLHRHPGNQEVRVHTEKIACYEANPIPQNPCTKVAIVGEEQEIIVKETPKEITSMIKEK